MRGAMKVIRNCLGVRSGDKVLIITDSGIDPFVSACLFQAATQLRAEPVTATIPIRSSANDDPPRRVVRMMLQSDAIACPTTVTMFYTNSARRACSGGARLVAMTGATTQVLSNGAIEANFEKQKPLVEALAKRLSNAKRILIQAPAGTRISASLTGRRAIANTGISKEPGELTGVPDIEAYIAPVESSVNGTIVVDATISGYGLVRKPVRLQIRHGKVSGIADGPCRTYLEKALRVGGRSASQVAEIGIGLNPKAKIRGAIVEDESALGTAHIALGDNSRFGGKNLARVHIDLVFKNPKITLDNKLLNLKQGL